MTRYDPRIPVSHHALRDEMVARATRLLKQAGVERVEEVDDAGNYIWQREYETDDIWILEEIYGLTVYIRVPGATDVACAFRDPEAGYIVVSHWNYDLVIKVLETLRQEMVLEDLADL